MIVATAAEFERAQRYLGHLAGAAERAMSRALNRAATAARTSAVAKITETYEVQAADVQARMELTTAKPDRLGVALRLRSPAMPLHYYPHSPSAPGTGGRGKPALRATVKRGATKTVAGAFVAQLGSKPRIAIRTGGQTKSGKDALRVLYSVPIAEMLGSPSVRAYVEGEALDALDAALSREIDRALAESP